MILLYYYQISYFSSVYINALFGIFNVSVYNMMLELSLDADNFQIRKNHCQKILRTISPEYVITDIDGELSIVCLDDNYYECNEPDPALIMCTSGTTGDPKGVMLSEENIFCNLTDILDYFKITKEDKILIIRPLYHCAVLTGEFLVSLLRELDIYFYIDDFNPFKIINLAKRISATVICGTPTLFNFLSRINLIQKDKLQLKNIVISGECITERTAQSIRNNFSSANIYHVYGLTEASPRVAYLAPEYFENNPCAVGHVLNSIEYKIIDDNGLKLQSDNIGELIVKVKSIMLGYFNNSEATQNKLCDGWLKTGDMAFVDKDGFLYIKGRKDDMIIHAGINIYPQEIENALRKDLRVGDVLAYGITDEYCGEKIGLKITGDFSNVNEVLELCKEKLSSYQIPSTIEIVDELPKNASGKTVRRKNYE